MHEFITLLVHGESKTGKTWLGDTTPAPRLILDAEAGGIRFTPSQKVMWNPMQDPAPEPDGSWDTCVVKAGSLQVLHQTYQVLASGSHPFKSVTLDSVMEIQTQAKHALTGGPDNVLEMQGWGRLLGQIEDVVRRFRDLTDETMYSNPLHAVVYVCGTRLRDGMFRPLLEGQVVVRLPYLVDACGFLVVAHDDAGNTRRALSIEAGGTAVAGNRFGGRLPAVIWDPNVEQMLAQLGGQ